MNGKTLCTVIGVVGTVVSAVAGVIGMNMEVKETVDKELDRRGFNKVEKFGEDDIEVIDNEEES